MKGGVNKSAVQPVTLFVSDLEQVIWEVLSSKTVNNKQQTGMADRHLMSLQTTMAVGSTAHCLHTMHGGLPSDRTLA